MRVPATPHWDSPLARQNPVDDDAVPWPAGPARDPFFVQPCGDAIEPEPLAPERLQPLERRALALVEPERLPPFTAALSGALPQPGAAQLQNDLRFATAPIICRTRMRVGSFAMRSGSSTLTISKRCLRDSFIRVSWTMKSRASRSSFSISTTFAPSPCRASISADSAGRFSRSFVPLMRPEISLMPS